MRYFYSFSIFLTCFMAKVAALFSQKVKMQLKRKKELLLKMEFEMFDSDDEQLIWFHCNSHAEFEQGRIVLESIKKKFPEKKTLITFSENNMFEHINNCSNADYVFCLPSDKRSNAKKFLEIWRPVVAIFVSYNNCLRYFSEMHERRIPFVFISSVLKKDQHFFRFYGKWYRKQLKKATYFFVKDEESLKLLKNINVQNAILSGDTRFDMAYETKENPISYSTVENFIQGSIIFIAGSIASKDHEVLVPLINENYNGIKYIIVPDEKDDKLINNLVKDITGKTVLLSDKDKAAYPEAQVLIVDKEGILPQLYQYASIAYIGGGFAKGVHNIIEAAVFGMPVLFGPNYKNLQEAHQLIKYGGGFCVKSKDDLINETYRILSNYYALKEASEISKEYVRLKKGATHKIMIFLQALINTSKSLARTFQKEINLN